MIDIFTYTDYRKLLKDLYEERKSQNPHFSYRLIARKAGFSSAGFFSNILNGKRNISQENIFRFSELFKLNKKETEYFDLLVHFNQAKNHEQRKYYFEKILGHKKSKVKVTDAAQYEFYRTWYYTAIRELINIVPFKGDTSELARMVSPSITEAEARKAVEFLENNGFIRKDDFGYYVQCDPFITTGYDAHSVAINNFVIATAELAKEAIDRYPRDQRSMGTLTLTMSEKTYKEIHERLKGFTREIMELVREDQKPETVYHFNFHVFPLSKR